MGQEERIYWYRIKLLLTMKWMVKKEKKNSSENKEKVRLTRRKEEEASKMLAV